MIKSLFFSILITYKVNSNCKPLSGHEPYQDLSVVEVINAIQNKDHLEIPPSCPQTLSEQLMNCWSYYADDRPSFAALLIVIKDLLRELVLQSQNVDSEEIYHELISDAHSC